MCCWPTKSVPYSELKKDLPKVGKRVVTPKGPGKSPSRTSSPEIKSGLDNGDESGVGFDEIREESFFDRVRKGK